MMQLEYLGYFIEPVCAFDDALRHWKAAVILGRIGASGSLQFQSAGGHASEFNACNAALMHGQNIVLSHVNGRSRALAELDLARSAGYGG
jgi:hypothetical protein